MADIENGNLDKFQTPESRGWFIGSFITLKSPFHSGKFEVKWSKHVLGEKKPKPEGGRVKTITFLIEGEFLVSFPETKEEYRLEKIGDYVYFGENVLHTWECLKENSRMLTIRWPSRSSRTQELVSILNSKIFSVLVTLIVLFAPPLIATHWYVEQISVDEFAPTYAVTNAIVNTNLPNPSLSVSSSTPLTNFKSDKKFLDFEQMTSYLSLFNINPSLIKYNLYLENQVSAQVSYTTDGKETQSVILPSILVCDQNQIKADDKPFLMKSGLQLNDPENADREYVAAIYNQCASEGEVALQNTIGKTVAIEAITIEPGSGVRMLVKPEGFSDAIILGTFLVLWAGFIILMIQSFKSIEGLLSSGPNR